jgi:calcineurin-like phosphoesterase family protein
MEWFSSDFHWAHKNICKGVSEWPDKDINCRPFENIGDMNNAIATGINKYVKEDDVLYFLGDFCFDGIFNVWNCRRKINCKNIIFIMGNHDGHIRNNKILPNCSFIDGEIADAAPTSVYNSVKARDLFKNVFDYLEIIVNKTKVILCHFPIEEWNDRHHKSIHLHGHQHGKNRIIKNRLDVGIDVAFKKFGEFKPFSMEEINEILQIQNSSI